MRQEFAHATIKHGTHPIFLLKIFWTRETVGYYSDAKRYEYFEPKLLSLGNVGFSVSTTKTSESSSVSVVLDDTDGTIKNIIDSCDVHKATALVYQGFQDLAFVSLEESAFLLVRGEISTPVVWRESDRTISFDIVSPVENRQIGFSPDQGFFDDLAEDQVGKTWPLGFGEVIYQECPSVTTRKTGRLAVEYENLTLDKLEEIDRAYDNFYDLQVTVSAIEAEPDVNKKPSLEEYAELMEKYNYAVHYLWELVRWTAEVCDLEDNAEWNNYLNLNFEIIQLKREFDSKVKRLLIINRRIDEIDRILRGEGLDTATKNKITDERVLLVDEKEEIEERQTEITGLLETKLQERKNKLKLILTFQLSEIRLEPGHQFPTSGETIFLLINGVKFEGYINGVVNPNIFNVVNILPTNIDLAVADLPDTSEPYKYTTVFNLELGQPNIENHYCVFEHLGQVFIVYVTKQVGTMCYYSPQIFKKNTENNYDLQVLTINSQTNLWQTSPVFLREWFDYFNINVSEVKKLESLRTGLARLQPVDFKLKPGDIVYLDSEIYNEIHIINCVPRYYAYSQFVPTNDSATQYVEGVYAYRTINGVKTLEKVDPALYTLVENYVQNDVVLTYLKMPRRLSESDKTYSDTIYVSYKSGAAGGSQNTAEIIKYLILCFTYNPDGYNVNALSFLNVANLVQKYPMNFSISTRENTIDFVEKLAYQNRCAVYWYNQVAYITYLPKFYSLTTLNKDHILNNSLELSYESTDDIVTEHVAIWRIHPLQEKENRSTVRFNINKYGKVTEEVDYFAIKHQSTIEKSLTYWAIQKSFSYKILTFQGPLSLLRLMPFDHITISLEAGVVSNLTSVTGEVISLSYSPYELLCTVKVKTNVRAGEMFEYPFRWPYDVNQAWPYTHDVYFVGGNKAGLEGPTSLENLTFDLGRAKDYGKETLADAYDPTAGQLIGSTQIRTRPTPPPVTKNKDNLVIHTEKTFITDSTGSVARLDTLLVPVQTCPNRADSYLDTKSGFVAIKNEALFAGRDLFGNETKGSTLNIGLNPDMTWGDLRMPFVAKIIGHTQHESKLGAYKYDWQEVFVSSDPTGSNFGTPREGTVANGTYALNACEEPNTEAGVRWGNGIVYDTDKKVPGTNLTFQPVPPNTYVIMLPIMYYNGSNEKSFKYMFAVPNGTDGTCD